MTGPIKLDSGGFSLSNARFFARVCGAAYFPNDGPVQDAFGGGLLGLERFDRLAKVLGWPSEQWPFEPVAAGFRREGLP
jgi:hypothetical protein